MKDARGTTIEVGNSVVLLRTKEMEFGNYSHLAWGEVINFSPKMVTINANGQQVSRAPHNVVVAVFPEIPA